MADSKITALTALTSADPANDMIPIVDVSDTPPASGNTKRISINNILAASGTATLASATITGALTVGNGTSATQTFNGVTNILDIGYGSLRGGSAYGDVRLWTDRFRIYNNAGTQIIKNISGTNGDETWYDGAGGTRMTLNASGLGIGRGPLTSLDVFGANKTNANENGTLNVSSSDAFAIDKGGSIAFWGKYNTASGNACFARVYGAKENATDGNFVGYFAVATGGGGSPVERLRIDSSGNVISNVTGTAPTLATNSQMVFNLTSNTNLRISVRGTDGVTRTADLTLAP